MSANLSEPLGSAVEENGGGYQEQDINQPRRIPPTSTNNSAPSASGTLGLRLLRVVIVAICYFIIELVAKIVTVAQFVWFAWRKQPHPGMQRLGAMLSEYMHAMWRYCTFASNDAPWPFEPWPRGKVDQQR